MFEKLLFGFIAFVVSFFPIFYVVFKVAYATITVELPPEDADDLDLVSMAVFDRSLLWAFVSALFGGTLMAWGSAHFAGRLIRRRSLESFRRSLTAAERTLFASDSAAPVPLRQDPPVES